MPYGGDLRAVIRYFLDGDDCEELANEVSRRGIEAGLTVAELWNLPVHHLMFQFFKPPSRQGIDTDDDSLEIVRSQNATAACPFIPAWLATDHKRESQCSAKRSLSFPVKG